MTDLETRIEKRWEHLARLEGWQDAADSEMGELVVFHEDKAHHYVGPDAWKQAALHVDCPHCRKSSP